MKGKKRIGNLFVILAIGFAVVSLGAYIQSGITEFTTSLSSVVITAWVIGILLCMAGGVLNARALRFCGYLAMLYALLKSVSVQGTYIVNVLVSIDGTSFSKGFLITVAAGVIAVVIALIAAVKGEKEMEGEHE